MLTRAIEYDRTLGWLVCESAGGPATYVLWQVNGADTDFPSSQFITSSLDATYVNILELNAEPDDIIGNHSCQVINPRGRTEVSTLELRGEFGVFPQCFASGYVTLLP